MNARQLPQRDYDRLKDATAELVEAAGGPKLAASVTRADPARLSRYGNRHEAMFAAIDMIADLEAEVGQPIVTRVLAELSGYQLVPSKSSAADPEHLARHLGEVANAAAGVLGAVGESVADGNVTGRELDTIEQRAADLEREAAELRADARRAREGKPEALRVVTAGKGRAA